MKLCFSLHAKISFIVILIIKDIQRSKKFKIGKERLTTRHCIKNDCLTPLQTSELSRGSTSHLFVLCFGWIDCTR